MLEHQPLCNLGLIVCW